MPVTGTKSKSASKEQVLMMTAIPRSSGNAHSALQFTENLKKLKEVLPNTDTATIASLLKEENNSIEI